MRDNVPLVSKAMTVLGAFSVTKDSGKSSIFMLSFTYGFPLYTEQRRYINFHETTDQSTNQSYSENTSVQPVLWEIRLPLDSPSDKPPRC